MTDVFSWGDSDPFEEDDSWMSEPESVCNNWRGWKKGSNSGVNFNGNSVNGGGNCASTSALVAGYSAGGVNGAPLPLNLQSASNAVTAGPGSSLTGLTTAVSAGGVLGGMNTINPHRPSSPTYAILNSSYRDGSSVLSLTELAARVVASYIPFEVVERFHPPVPEPLQLRIAFWSFPDNEEDIRLYSCLANGSADEFQKGETLYRGRAVQSLLQIGFHLSATVLSPAIKVCTVAVTFDRGRITSCSCTCNCPSSWCSHVVAVCLHRIYQPITVCLRAPVSESLSRLTRDQLRKFAQYLITEFPQQILPTAQRLLDDLLLNESSNINKVCGAPDPTAGASIQDQTKWCLDENQLHDNIRKIVIKLCIPSPMVFSDVNFLSTTAPPAASEWTSLLRPLRGREPEGLWNLLSIVREMLRRHDRNSIPLLKILTEEILTCDQIVLWWFNTNVSLHRGYPPSSYNLNGTVGGGNNGGNGNNNRTNIHTNIHASQHACSSLCDEIVVLWRLVTLNPALSPQDTQFLFEQLRKYHLQTMEKVIDLKPTAIHPQSPLTNLSSPSSSPSSRTSDIEIFTGFKPAMVSCLIDWNTYPIHGVTNQYNRYASPYCPSINAQSSATSSCNHAISGMVKLNPHPWTKTYSKQSSSDSSNNQNSDDMKELNVDDNQLNDSNDNSEDSGMNNAELWDRASTFSSGDDNESNEGPNGERQPLHPNPRHNSHLNNVGPDYQIYVYNTRSGNTANKSSANNTSNDNPVEKQYQPLLVVAAQVKPIDDSFEILFSRAEALYAHGYVNEACQLSVRLAEQLLNNPPVLQIDQNSEQNITQMPPPPQPPLLSNPRDTRSHTKRSLRCRFNPALHQISLLASATLSKAAFLCQVLSENEASHLLAFHVGLFGLELVRPPASTKALEVKLANQEQELVNSLKRIPLCSRALAVLREKAEQLRDGRLTTRGEALLPLILASYIFDALVLSNSPSTNPSAAYNQNCLHSSFTSNALRLSTDERLGFDASVAAIGLKANVAEAEHPLLCEGTRRQRGELALTLLVHYKDNKERLNKIMDKLLDKDIHQIYRKPSASNLIHDSGPSTSSANTDSSNRCTVTNNATDYAQPISSPSRNASLEMPFYAAEQSASSDSVNNSKEVLPRSSPEVNSNSNWDNENNAWEAKFRQMNLNNDESKHSASCASTTTNIISSLDSSAPETTSSDNSPTVSRRNLFLASTKAVTSDSSSSGESSDSFSSTSSTEQKVPRNITSQGSTSHHHKHISEVSYSDSSGNDQSPPTVIDQTSNQSNSTFESSSFNNRSYVSWAHNGMTNSPGPMIPSTHNYGQNARMSNGLKSNNSSFSMAGNGISLKPLRFKGKRGHYPIIPNQPSEAYAHFMFELAKTVLAKAGGNNTSALFTQPPSTQNCRAPHRNLHMCAFQIGLYALGLHNAVSPNWLSRTYSSHVSWITGQAMEIGHQAIAFLIDTWEGHLTPTEVAELADRASRGQEPSMVQAAAQLALSCLPHSHALTPSEIQRALIQCKEQSNEMLERACLAVEAAAQSGGVYPEVLFHVARKWHELYENEVRISEVSSRRQNNNNNNHHQAQAQQQAPIIDLASLELAANEANCDQVPTEFVYYNEPAAVSYVVGPQFGTEAYAESSVSAEALAVNGAPIVLNSAANGANVQTNSVQMFQGQMFPTQMYQTTGYNQQYNPNVRYYANTAYNPNMASMPQVGNGRYYTQYSYAPMTSNIASGTQQQTQPQLLPIPTYSNNFYPMLQPAQQNKQQMGQMTPFYYTAQGNTQHCSQPTTLMRPSGQFMVPQAGLQSNGQAPLMYPLPNTYSYLNFSKGAYTLTPAPHPHQAAVSVNATQSIHLTPRQLGYMHSVYRVGMLALDTLARRVHDDRPNTKYARNPSYCEDVKWLLFIAKKLGSSYVQEVCMCSVNAVASPFVLYDIIMEAAPSLAHVSSATNTPYLATIRSQLLTPLIQKCQQLFAACIYFQIVHTQPGDCEDFLTTLRAARTAFHLMPGGQIHFNELLQSLRRTKTCKREMWAIITNAMQTS